MNGEVSAATIRSPNGRSDERVTPKRVANPRPRAERLVSGLLFRDGGRDSRIYLLAALGVYLAAVFLAAAGGFDLWRLLGVPTAHPRFLDMNVITSGWECTRQGYDVLVQNPCDPWDRPTNYPRIWMSLAPLGLGQSSTVALALAVWAAFFAAVFSLIGRLTRGEALVYATVLLSP